MPSHIPFLSLRSSALALCLFAAGCDGVAGDYDGGGAGGAGGGGAAAAGPFFRTEVQDLLVSSSCLGCHATGTAPMQAKKAPATEGEWQQNFAQVSPRADQLSPKAIGGGGHPKVMTAGDPALAVWDRWAAAGAPYSAAAADAGSGGGSGSGGGAGGGGGSAGGSGGGGGSGGAGGGSAGGAGGGGGVVVDAGTPVTWKKDIGPLMVSRGCTNCHGNSGKYSLQTYTAALGGGANTTPNVIPGDSGSALVVYCYDGHKGIGAADALKVMRWVVDWGAVEQ